MPQREAATSAHQADDDESRDHVATNLPNAYARLEIEKTTSVLALDEANSVLDSPLSSVPEPRFRLSPQAAAQQPRAVSCRTRPELKHAVERTERLIKGYQVRYPASKQEEALLHFNITGSI